MAREVVFGDGGAGKIRNFWIGFLLSWVTLGIYTFCWYYLVNDELKDIGVSRGDKKLSESSPAMSTAAILVGGFVLIPPFLSIYNYGQRIKRAQRIAGVPEARQISPVAAFLLFFPGFLLVLPAFVHYWYVTRHQNRAVVAAGG